MYVISVAKLFNFCIAVASLEHEHIIRQGSSPSLSKFLPLAAMLRTDECHPATCLSCMVGLRKDRKLCDVVIQVDPEGKQFLAHRIVLAGSSPYFQARTSIIIVCMDSQSGNERQELFHATKLQTKPLTCRIG